MESTGSKTPMYLFSWFYLTEKRTGNLTDSNIPTVRHLVEKGNSSPECVLQHASSLFCSTHRHLFCNTTSHVFCNLTFCILQGQVFYFATSIF